MWPAGVWYTPQGNIYSRMRKWQILDGIVISCSYVRWPFNVEGARTNQNKKYEITNEKAKPKIELIIEVWDTYIKHHVQGPALCIFHQYCIACNSNNNICSEWCLTPTTMPHGHCSNRST
jgi:hypothetical protein